jgi:hypothetical protein
MVQSKRAPSLSPAVLHHVSFPGESAEYGAARNALLHHFWGSEVLYMPPESSPEYRHNDASTRLGICSTSPPRGAATFIRN